MTGILLLGDWPPKGAWPNGTAFFVYKTGKSGDIEKVK
jgi:hypothetical protein